MLTNLMDDVMIYPRKSMALTVYHIIKSDQCVHRALMLIAPNIQTMFMVNLLSEDPNYDEAGPSYDSNTPFEVQDHDTFVDNMDEYHEVHEMQNDGIQSMSANKQVKVVNDTLTSELARYKELVGVYEKRTKFKLTEREQKIDEQMRIIISDRNRKETSLKSKLHTVQMQLRSTVDHNKSMKEEVTILKKNFKQKEDKYIERVYSI
ncbi:hypothetical protein Tco_0710065 [Tanacetum coccineum]